MQRFTKKERVQFRLGKYAREHIFDFFVSLLGHTLLTELVVYLCGGTKFFSAFLLALAYAAGRWLYELYYFKKEWLETEKVE